jgi:hypothetical protein
MNGQADVMYLGTVGAVAGTFVFRAEQSKVPEIWGVMQLDTNFEKLRPLGIDTDLVGSLYLNTSTERKYETLTLPGQASGGGDLTKTYTLEPLMFRVETTGRLNLHVPDFNEDDEFGIQLFRMVGSFSFEISSEGLEVFADAEIEVGPDDVQLLNIYGIGVFIINDRGFAGDIEVGFDVGNIAAIKDFFDFNASARVVFNVTSQLAEVKVSDAFLPNLSDEAKSRIRPCSDGGNDNASNCYPVGAGAPNIDGTFDAPSPYFTMMANGTLEMLKFFKVEGSFFFSVSLLEIEMRMNASFEFKPFITVVVSGTLMLSREGILGALQFGASLKIGPTLEIFGASQFEINTYPTYPAL